MFYIDDARREYIARQAGDLGKNIMTVALASYFFEKFPLLMRIGICIIGIILIIIGFMIQPPKKGDYLWWY